MLIDKLNPVALIIVGGVLVVLGAVLPFLIVTGVLTSTYFLNFFAYIASFLGLLMGVVGSALYVRNRRRRK